MSKVLEHGPLPNNSTIVGALRGVFQATELANWSAAGLQGVFGHAFNFNMKADGGEVWQEGYLDYHAGFLETQPEIARFRILQAHQAKEEGDFTALKADAWDAVRQSIDRGIPAIAWQPMSLEQRAGGVRAGAWGLLVGYDGSDETYTVRHQYHRGGESYTVRYDAIGHTDPSEWFCVLVYDGPAAADLKDVHLRALRNAIAFAEGTRSESKAYLKFDARGLAAYELWVDALETEGVSADHSHVHAFKLTRFREHAAGYLRELVDVFPEAASQLEGAAAHYDREISVTRRVDEFCSATNEAGGFTAESRAEARTMVSEALEAERDAIAGIEATLVLVDESW